LEECCERAKGDPTETWRQMRLLSALVCLLAVLARGCSSSQARRVCARGDLRAGGPGVLSRGVAKHHGIVGRLRGGGLLVVGTPLEWPDSLPHLGYVREHGVLQFIHQYNEHKERECDKLLWGEELEYPILKVDREKKTVKLSLRGAEVLECLREKEEAHGRSDNRKEACAWHPEYGSWMVEGTPRLPFGGFVRDLRRVELSLRLRRKRILSALQKDEIAPTVTAFPLMGTTDFTDPPFEAGGPAAESSYCSDALINPHPRFGTLTANIRKRRGEKVNIKVPLYMDENTNKGKDWGEEGEEVLRASGLEWHAPRKEMIHMDAMCFGMGMCCVQVTFQCRDIFESRHLYDQLAVLTPIMLSLSAATPILKGHLADTDVRWATIAASVDDRTMQERGLDLCSVKNKGHTQWMAGGGARPLPKSRYESISCYICNCKHGQDPTSNLDKYNDVHCPIDEASYATLRAGGVDEPLARHIAHLFVRDPLVIFSERIHIPDTTSTDHFENIQSTNWQTVRWKPPPAGSGIGWRVEFRSMEAQLTDFENAAFSVMTVLISRVLLAFRLNLYIPLSKVDENMATAHKRLSVVEGKFWFRKHMARPDNLAEGEGGDDFELMSVYEILTGKGTHYAGLLPMVFAYLDQIGCDRQTRDKIRQYAKLFEKRAAGELQTAATWQREFVTRHPSYKRDSVVSQEIAHDLMVACSDIGEGRRHEPSLLGQFVVEELTTGGAYEVPLESGPIDLEKRDLLIQKYAQRSMENRKGGGSVSDGWKTPATRSSYDFNQRLEQSDGQQELLTDHGTHSSHKSSKNVSRRLSGVELARARNEEESSSSEGDEDHGVP